MNNMVEQGEGIRFDESKPRWDLLPLDSLYEVLKVYSFGIKKGYPERNWEKGMNYSRIYNPILRHTTKWFIGQDLDEESNLPHLAHATWNCLTGLTYQLRSMTKFDDRVKVKLNI